MPVSRIHSRIPDRILFVELLGGIGDLVFILPAIEALKQAYRAARLDVLTFAPGGELLIGDPRVHQVFFARRVHGEGSADALQKDVSAVLASEPFDLIVSDARHSGIHELIEATPMARKVTHLWSGAGRDEPIAQLFLRRLCEEGVIDSYPSNVRSTIFVTSDERRAASALWSSLDVEPERTVVLNPHSGVAVKRWPIDHFLTLGQGLAGDGFSIAILAGDDPHLAWQIARLIPGARFLPKVPLRLTAACLERCALLVSGDSGIAHLASAVGTPVVAIFGPTWSGRYGVAEPSLNVQSPFDCPELNPMNFTTQRCWFSGKCIFPGKENCCEDVTPQSVLTAARTLLEDTGA